jgi:hypothetical protein
MRVTTFPGVPNVIAPGPITISVGGWRRSQIHATADTDHRRKNGGHPGSLPAPPHDERAEHSKEADDNVVVALALDDGGHGAPYPSPSPATARRLASRCGVEVLSTYDQALGGPSGQRYLGCRFPADPTYATLITP